MTSPGHPVLGAFGLCGLWKTREGNEKAAYQNRSGLGSAVRISGGTAFRVQVARESRLLVNVRFAGWVEASRWCRLL